MSVIGAETSFFLPLSVVPLYVKSSSGSGAGAGLATGALLAAGVAGELATPRLVSLAGYRLSLAVGLLLLGAPALVLLWPVPLPVVVVVNVACGFGFAITTVAGGALTTLLVPAGRRGEGLACTASSPACPRWSACRRGCGRPAAARAVADAVPGGRYVTLDGQDHGVLQQPDTLRPLLTSYFNAE